MSKYSEPTSLKCIYNRGLANHEARVMSRLIRQSTSVCTSSIKRHAPISKNKTLLTSRRGLGRIGSKYVSADELDRRKLYLYLQRVAGS